MWSVYQLSVSKRCVNRVSNMLTRSDCRGRAGKSGQHLRQLMVPIKALPVNLVQHAELPQGIQADDP